MFDFSKTVDRHGTWCTQWDYIADRFGANDLLPFTISDMDFATAPCITETLENALRTVFLVIVAGSTKISLAPYDTGMPNASIAPLIPTPRFMALRSSIWSPSSFDFGLNRANAW